MNVRLNVRTVAMAAPIFAGAFLAGPGPAEARAASVVRATTVTTLVRASHHHGYRVLTVHGGQRGTLVIVNGKHGTETQIFGRHHHRLFAKNVPESLRQTDRRVVALAKKGGLHYSQVLHREVFEYNQIVKPGDLGLKKPATLAPAAETLAPQPAIQPAAAPQLPQGTAPVEGSQPPAVPVATPQPATPLLAPASVPQAPPALTQADRIQPPLMPDAPNPWPLLMMARIVAARKPLGKIKDSVFGFGKSALEFTLSAMLIGIRPTVNRRYRARLVAEHKAQTEAAVAPATGVASAAPITQPTVAAAAPNLPEKAQQFGRAVSAAFGNSGAWIKAKVWQPAVMVWADINQKVAVPFQRETGAFYPVPAVINRMAKGLNKQTTASVGAATAGVILAGGAVTPAAPPAEQSAMTFPPLEAADNLDWRVYSKRDRTKALFDVGANCDNRGHPRSLSDMLRAADAVIPAGDAPHATQKAFRVTATALLLAGPTTQPQPVIASPVATLAVNTIGVTAQGLTADQLATGLDEAYFAREFALLHPTGKFAEPTALAIVATTVEGVVKAAGQTSDALSIYDRLKRQIAVWNREAEELAQPETPAAKSTLSEFKITLA